MSDRDKGFSERFSDMWEGAKQGFKQGFKSPIQTTISGPKKPPLDVMQDVGTVVWDKGPVKTHKELAEKSKQELSPQSQQQVRRMHDFGYGFGTGYVMPSLMFASSMFLAKRRFPKFAPHIARAQKFNMLIGLWNMANMPGHVDQQLQQRFPRAYDFAKQKLHTEAEGIRQKNTGNKT